MFLKFKEIYVLIDDKKKQPGARTFYEYDEKFKELNQKGWGVYFAVNEFEPTLEQINEINAATSRHNDLCTKLRYVYADLDIAKSGDNQTREEKEARKEIVIKALKEKCEPTYIIDTSNGLQPLWKLEDGTVNEKTKKKYVRTIKGVIAWSKQHGCKADKVQDIARILRVPGFYHQKEEPYLCDIIHKSAKKYSLDDLSQAFPFEEKEYIPKIFDRSNLGIVDKAIDALDFQELIIKAFTSTNRKAEFDKTGRLILDGRLTGTFQGKKDDRQYLASTSHEPFEGNKITALADILQVTNKEARQWIISEYKLDYSKLQRKGIVEEQLKTTVEKPVKDYRLRYTWGTPEIDKRFAIIKRTDLIVFASKRGQGKCFAEETEILMYNGTIKKVEDIIVGDKLMGDDSTPRVILSLARGQEQMYWIKQNKAMDYRVNESHILTLKNRFGLNGGKKRIIDIPVKDYLKKSNKFKRQSYCYKSQIPLKFQKQYKPKFSPYLLGLWIADGRKNGPCFSVNNKDVEIKEFIVSQTKKINDTKISFRNKQKNSNDIAIVFNQKNKNPINDYLRKLKIFNNKHIPYQFKIMNVEDRLEFLAGYLDGDGHKLIGNTICYSCSSSNKKIIEGINFIAQSLGFSTNYAYRKRIDKRTEKKYRSYELIIGGDIERIPLKLKRKKIEYTTRKNEWNISSFKIEKDIIDNYYGFEIDGNKRFLLKDGTVVHNTTYTFDMAVKNAGLGHKVLYISLEMTAKEIKEDFARKYSGITIEEEYKYEIPILKQKAFKRKIQELESIENMIFEGMRRGENIIWETISTVIEKHDDLDLIFIDNLDRIGADERESNLDKQKRIINAIMSFTAKQQIPIVLIHHHRKSMSGKDFGMDELSGSGKIADGADRVLKIIHEPKLEADYPEKYKTTLFLQKARGYSPAVKEVYFIKGTFMDNYPLHEKYYNQSNEDEEVDVIQYFGYKD